MLFLSANKDHAKIVRAIVKKHGINKCRVSGHTIAIGSQNEHIPAETALKIIVELKEHNFASDIESILLQIIENDNLYGFHVSPISK